MSWGTPGCNTVNFLTHLLINKLTSVWRLDYAEWALNLILHTRAPYYTPLLSQSNDMFTQISSNSIDDLL